MKMRDRQIPKVGLLSMHNNYTFNGRPLKALDASERLFWVEDFLSEEEVDIFRAVGAANPAAFEAVDRLDYATATLPRNNEVTEVIEERIAALTGIAVNEADSPIHLAVTRTWEPTRPHCFNLHHDTHKGFSERVATVLIFLADEDADGLGGGETMFPCLVPAGATADEHECRSPPAEAERDLCARLMDGFERGERFLRINSASHEKPSFDGAASAAASEACAATRTMAESGRRGIRVQPRRGAAIFFWSADVDDVSPACSGATPLAHPEMWHGGCRVHAGEKWTAQQFKAWRPDV